MALQDNTWSVKDLSAAIEEALSSHFPSVVWVRGEITGYHFHASSGHTYFTLVEQGASADRNTAKIPVALFAGSRNSITDDLTDANLSLQDGIEVRVGGRVGYYPAQSKTQLYMSAIDPNFTLGQLEKDRTALLKSLQAEGLLEKNGSLALSPVPLRIGLITSATSAACADFTDEITSSGYAFEVTLCDTRVQGEQAPQSLVSALATLERYAQAEGGLDVIAMVRGGGDRNDLLTFDTELVARAVAGCSLPVVVGIGHEIDESVVDKVAHTSFKTPTACAAGLVEMVDNFEVALDTSAQTLARRSTAATHSARVSLSSYSRSLGIMASKPLERANSQLGQAVSQLRDRTHSRCNAASRSLSGTAQRLSRAAKQQIKTARAALDSHNALVNSHDPRHVLERGFSITRNTGTRNTGTRNTGAGTVVRTLPETGDELETTTHAGVFRSTVSNS